ncbi:hypothetical protein HQM25_01245 [Microbacterium hominis]|uniref:Uncharacterized protein n=2 Tax=Microbacterium hominis TaxID=162426 RepID=A0A7D4QEK4_9MICO|nr:hypothetical protein HQM25_01245 [Microbacterium hominis]
MPVTAALAASTLLAGCAGIGTPPFVESRSCASWAALETHEERLAESDAVIVADTITPDGTAEVMGFDANAYRVTVAAVEKGPLEVGETVRVASTADNCAARPYGDGDPLLGDPPLRLYLTDVDGSWRTLTPFDGVAPAD